MIFFLQVGNGVKYAVDCVSKYIIFLNMSFPANHVNCWVFLQKSSFILNLGKNLMKFFLKKNVFITLKGIFNYLARSCFFHLVETFFVNICSEKINNSLLKSHFLHINVLNLKLSWWCNVFSPVALCQQSLAIYS